MQTQESPYRNSVETFMQTAPLVECLPVTSLLEVAGVMDMPLAELVNRYQMHDEPRWIA
jgi:hypothetical protein